MTKNAVKSWILAKSSKKEFDNSIFRGAKASQKCGAFSFAAFSK
jgi:hypothetical protein